MRLALSKRLRNGSLTNCRACSSSCASSLPGRVDLRAQERAGLRRADDREVDARLAQRPDDLVLEIVERDRPAVERPFLELEVARAAEQRRRRQSLEDARDGERVVRVDVVRERFGLAVEPGRLGEVVDVLAERGVVLEAGVVDDAVLDVGAQQRVERRLVERLRERHADHREEGQADGDAGQERAPGGKPRRRCANTVSDGNGVGNGQVARTWRGILRTDMRFLPVTGSVPVWISFS